MRADEPIKADPSWKIFADYINQLRYDRAMAKARYFRLAEYLLNASNRMKYRYRRIAEAYEARAKRIKEGT